MYFKKNHLRKWEIALLIALCAATLSGVWAAGRQQALSDKLIRLHVVAVSDSERDQAVKLEVRDEILKLLVPELSEVSTREMAEEKIEGLLPAIQKRAQEASLARGESYGAVVTLENESYPTRYYNDFALPAGEYLSLRVILGEGEGRNWWCVVFPPLCAAAAEGVAVTAGGSSLSEDDISLITEEDGYEIRFKVVELWGRLKKLIAK